MIGRRPVKRADVKMDVKSDVRSDVKMDVRRVARLGVTLLSPGSLLALIDAIPTMGVPYRDARWRP